MPKLIPKPRRLFPKVKEAREALAAKALELYELYDKAIVRAMEAEQFDIAIEAIQWAMLHMPKDEDGTAVIDQDIDKPKQVDKGGSPTIQIGFKLGGITEHKVLPEHVIDITPVKPSNE
jgi:hypothetical protein